MNKKIIFGIAIIFLLIIAIVKVSIDSRNKNSLNESASTNIAQADKVQVFLFHATRRCSTCIAIGRLAGETVNERFQNELKSGQIEFREVNIDLPENKELAQKFQASGSALYLNAIKDGVDNIGQDTKVWSLVGNTEKFKDYLEGRIINLLGKKSL
jgi:thiol-disulfide isomerase/thioredoxin